MFANPGTTRSLRLGDYNRSHGVAVPHDGRARILAWVTCAMLRDGWTGVADPYLVATKLREDAVVGYHAALELHGKAYSAWSRVQYVTAARVRPFRFRGTEFVGEQAPAAVRDLPDFGGGVELRPHAGGEVRVTSL